MVGSQQQDKWNDTINLVIRW